MTQSQASVGDDAPADSVAPGRDAPGRGPRTLARSIRPRPTLEHLLVAVLALMVLAVHDVGYIFSQPYWTDEDWVALTTKFPLSALPATTNSTPIGWSVLIRFFTVSGTQSARIVPLAFAGLAVVVAYWFGRRLDWARREVAIGAGVLAGIAMLLVPAMLIRDDLKQYTTDAFFAMLVLAVTSRLERGWSRRVLVTLSVVTWGGMLFSDAVAFMGAAAFGAVCLVQLVRRAWRRLAEAAITGVITAVLILAVYKAFDARAVTKSLTFSPHFASYYPPRRHLHALVHFVIQHLQGEETHFGLGPLWLVVLLFVLGVVTIFLVGRPITAVLLAILWPEMLLISALHLFPFVDARTSTFLFATTAVVAAIGVAGVCSLLLPYLKGTLAAGLAVVAVAGFVVAGMPFERGHYIPSEDTKAITLYLADHVPASDTIVLAQDSNFGFAYYWRTGQPSRVPDDTIIQLYEADFPSQPRIVVATTRTAAGVDAAMNQALAQSRAHGCAPMYLVRTHLTAIEEAAYNSWLDQHHLRPVAAGPGLAGLSFVPLNASACQ
ncbi:MAG TPA: hypothetical protein VMU95_30605 [Trebonia sp.]|nr:hypothetical protein [Trebonia sp.]